MIITNCPLCMESVVINENELHSICQNFECSEIVHFSVFTNNSDIETFKIDYISDNYIFSEEKKDEYYILAYYKKVNKRYLSPSLSKLIHEDILKSIQAGFADYIGSPLTLFDINDTTTFRRVEPIAHRKNIFEDIDNMEASFRNFCNFCRTIRTNEVNGVRRGNDICSNFDLQVIKRIIRKKILKASYHYCWCGFLEFTAPIIVNRKIVGVIITGQKINSEKIIQNIMKNRIIEAANMLGLEKEKMLSLAFDNDIQLYDKEKILAMIKEINGIAEKLQNIAENEYLSKRGIIEREFFDYIDEYFKEILKIINDDEESLYALFSLILKSICSFTSVKCVGLFTKSRESKYKYEYRAGNFWKVQSNRNTITLNIKDYIRNYKKTLNPFFTNELNPFYHYTDNDINRYMINSQKEMDITSCVLPIKSHSSDVLIILAYCKEDSTVDVSYLESEYGMNFLKGLAHTLGEHLDLCFNVSSIIKEQKRTSHLMISLGHEINTPIQSMIADSSNLVEELNDNSEISIIAQHNLDEVKRLHLLSENIIAILSKKKDPKSNYELHSIYKPISEACEMFRGEAEEKGCSIYGPKSTKGSFPIIEMSLFDLTLAFKNLIHNAVKYSFYPAKGYEHDRFIKVFGKWYDEEKKDKYIIEITNYGVGIKQEEIDKKLIFEPFYRSELSKDRNRTGSGLGLALVRNVIEEIHKGEIKVLSIPMPGTAYLNVFSVLLPVAQNHYQED